MKKYLFFYVFAQFTFPGLGWCQSETGNSTPPVLECPPPVSIYCYEREFYRAGRPYAEADSMQFKDAISEICCPEGFSITRTWSVYNKETVQKCNQSIFIRFNLEQVPTIQCPKYIKVNHDPSPGVSRPVADPEYRAFTDAALLDRFAPKRHLVLV